MAILKIAVAICEKFGDVKSTPVIYSSKSTSKPWKSYLSKISEVVDQKLLLRKKYKVL